MSILKLPNAGDEATLDITDVQIVTGEFGEQIKFVSGDDILFLPRSSADRQLERLGIAYEDAIGSPLTFSRTPSNKPGSKPYWNIALGQPAKVPPKANGAPPVAKTKASPPSFANKPEAELPEFLRDAESQDAAELKAKITGLDTDKIQKGLALYTAITEFVLRDIVPLYVKSEIGVSDQSVAAMSATLFIQANR